MAITQRDIDKQMLSISEYVDKYYSNIDLEDWEFWMENNINKAWSNSTRTSFLQAWKGRMDQFNFSEMERFYNEENLSVFDEDVKKFISYLAGSGFFHVHKIGFKEWLNMKNFTNPKKGYEQNITIYEALNIKGGMNYIRKQLINLFWWRE